MIYFDTSAVVKLVLAEQETTALQSWMRAESDATFFSSQLLSIELLRAVARTVPEQLERANAVLQGFALVKMDDDVVETASSLESPVLPALDRVLAAAAMVLPGAAGRCADVT